MANLNNERYLNEFTKFNQKLKRTLSFLPFLSVIIDFVNRKSFYFPHI